MSRTLGLMPSGLPEVKNRPWALVLRQHDMGGTDYETICYLSDDRALEVFEAGAPYWIFGKPNWDDRAKKRALERARVLREEAEKIEAANVNS